jgi:hypothetical protein
MTYLLNKHVESEIRVVGFRQPWNTFIEIKNKTANVNKSATLLFWFSVKYSRVGIIQEN